MVRYDLAFFLCCCNAFLRADADTASANEAEDYYGLLGIEADATPEEIKRAYKKHSLKHHPDKLTQRGQQVTAADQERFTNIKHAYEVLSDPHKRETFDALGAKGLKWVEAPFSGMDPAELAHNFATSSFLDRSKIFAIFVAIAIGIFVQPILICLAVDGILGPQANWFAVLVPIWLWNAFILFYHVRVIMMGPIPRPEDIPEEEWVDPLPMKRRYMSLARFLLFVVFEILIALRLQNIIDWKWSVLFIPIYILETVALYMKVLIARMQIVTVEELETTIMGKPCAEFTQEEKDDIAKTYTVVPSHNSPEFGEAYRMKIRARQEILRLLLRVLFVVFFVLQLDLGLDWSWWLVFIPVWVASFCICFGSMHNFVSIQTVAKKRDPEFFSGVDVENQANYGSMGDGDGPGGDSQEPISPEEREFLKATVAMSGQQLVSSCCSQSFLLLIICLLVAKLQNPDVYAAMWIIFPILLIAGMILCCLCCMIFCVSEDIPDFDTMGAATAGQSPSAYSDPEEGNVAPSGGNEQSANVVYVPPPPPQQQSMPETSGAEAQEPKPDELPTTLPSQQPVDLLDDASSPPPQEQPEDTNDALIDTNMQVVHSINSLD